MIPENWTLFDLSSDTAQLWRRWGNEFVCPAGCTWIPLLTGGLNRRAKSVADAVAGKWATTREEWKECDFEAVPCKAMGEEKYAYILYRVLSGPIRGSISYVPCDWSPDYVMRDVA